MVSIVGNQSQVTGSFDSYRERALTFGTHAGLTPRLNLGHVINETLNKIYVLVINLFTFDTRADPTPLSEEPSSWSSSVSYTHLTLPTILLV